MSRPILYIADILGWADAFRKRRGRWPRREDGPVAGTLDLTWCGIDQALRKGNRGLRPGSSLARLLLEHRGVRNKKMLPKFTDEDVLAWIPGAWPSCYAGPIADALGETWLAVDKALRYGTRGFPGGSSLAGFLAQNRGAKRGAASTRRCAKADAACLALHCIAYIGWSKESG